MHMPGKETEEKRQHSTALIPYSFYECRLPYDFMNVPMHWHSEFELAYVVRGQGIFTCGSERPLARAGDLMLILPNVLHAAYPCPRQELIYHALVFSPVMLGAGAYDRCTAECIRPLMNGSRSCRSLIPQNAKAYARIKECAGQIFSCSSSASPQKDLLLKSELLRLFWLLEMEKPAFFRQEAKDGYGESIRPALEYMRKNFRDDISIEQLAGITHLSKSYFMSSFKKAVGFGAIQYLSHLRISAACEALSSTEKRVCEIAFDCGYGNISHFNRQFKEMMGCSPNAYRKCGGCPVRGKRTER